MKSIIRSAFIGLCATALFLALSNSAQAQISAGSGELAVNGGLTNLDTVNSDGTLTTHAYQFGASAGYNFSQNVAVLGEYQYIPQGSYDGVTWKNQLYGANLRYSFGTGKFVPFVLVGGGGASSSMSQSGVSLTASGEYVTFGGGVSLFLGKNWGIRPEYRYNDFFSTSDGVTTTNGKNQGSVGIFFQFGGQQSSKKKASSGN